MSQRTPRTPSLLTKATESGIGDVHRWLKRHRRQVLNLCALGTEPWVTIAQQMAREGVQNSFGQSPSRDLVRKTWPYVLAAHAKQQAHKEAMRKGKEPRSNRPNVEPPSRPGVNLRPVRRGPLDAGYTPGEDAPPAYPATQPAVHPHGQNPPGKRTLEEKIAAVERQLREADGYEPPPPPRGRII